jgi:transposase
MCRCSARPSPGDRQSATRREDFFRVYLDKVLAPTLSEGNIVIMDNLPAHKGNAVKAAIEATGARLMFLPPYSPDLNPIEQAFSKLKTLFRKAAERTVGDLWDRLGIVLDAFTPQESANYFRYDGYKPT